MSKNKEAIENILKLLKQFGIPHTILADDMSEEEAQQAINNTDPNLN